MTDTTNATSMSPRQRIPLGFLLSSREEARRDAILRATWINIVQGFACRPSPRSAWDHAADGSEARWNKVLDPMRMAVASAVSIGNERLIEQTMEGVRDFLRAIEADIASLIPSKKEESVETLAIHEKECAGKGTVEALRLLSHPSPTEAERAVQVFTAEESSLVRLINWCQRTARQPSMRMAR